MKNFITGLSLLMIALTFGQTKSLSGTLETFEKETKIENLKIEITVDSAEEIKSTFSTEDIKRILDEISEDESIIFKMTCNNKNASSGYKSSASYTVKGNTDDKDFFIKSIKKVRKAAIKYYKNRA
ncbi:hypothetical protein [Winogradskyella flava]|uniref:hypothetical protein n=1 Tax=Winogradskyella flava TaxID=1884876 RepID=UPI0024931DE9|nr:hypothetical protein [Winogradskyella flava]